MLDQPTLEPISHQLFQELLENYDSPVVITSITGQLTMFNQNASSYFGLGLESLGKTVDELMQAHPLVAFLFAESKAADAELLEKNQNLTWHFTFNGEDHRIEKHLLPGRNFIVSYWGVGMVRQSLGISEVRSVISAIDRFRFALTPATSVSSLLASFTKALVNAEFINSFLIVKKNTKSMKILHSTSPIFTEEMDILDSFISSEATTITVPSSSTTFAKFALGSRGDLFACFLTPSSFLDDIGSSMLDLAIRQLSHEIDIRQSRETTGQAESALGSLRKALDKSSDVVFMVDLDLGKIILANNAATKRLGFDRRDYEEMNPSEIAKHLNAEDLTQKMTRAWSTGRKERLRTIIHTKAAGQFPGLISISRSTLSHRSGERILFLIIEDETKINAVEQSLKESETRYMLLADRMREGIENERARISREVHDVLGGAISGMIIHLNLLSKSWANGPMEVMDKIIQQANQALDSARSIATDLRPSILDQYGIIASLDWLANNFQSQHNIPCSFVTNESEDVGFELEEVINNRLTTQQSTQLFRIAQEALNNIVKYSRASFVRLSAQSTEDFFELVIQDNGIGMKMDATMGAPLPTLGLLSMQERARSANGNLEIVTAPGQGVAIYVKLVTDGAFSDKE